MKIVKLKKEETWWACRLRNEFAEREREGDVSETGEAVCGGFLDIFFKRVGTLSRAFLRFPSRV